MHGIIKKSKIIALVVFLYAASAKGVTVHEPYGSYPFDDTSTSIPCATIEHKNFDAIDDDVFYISKEPKCSGTECICKIFSNRYVAIKSLGHSFLSIGAGLSGTAAGLNFMGFSNASHIFLFVSSGLFIMHFSLLGLEKMQSKIR